MDSLKQKIRDVEEEHADESLTTHLDNAEKRKEQRALLLLGGIRAVNRVGENLTSQVMGALITFQQEELHTQLGFERFADFLDKSEFSPMKKSEFYRRKELYDAEGGQLYDAFNAARVPVSTRQLLAKRGETEISIDGDEIVIGNERADLSDLPTIKTLISDFAGDNKNLIEANVKAEKKVEDLKAKVKKGSDEYEELRRSYDALAEDGPFAKAVMKYLGAAQGLIAEINALPEAERTPRAEDDLRIFTEQLFRIRDAYGLKLSLNEESFERHERVAAMKPVEEMTDKERKATLADRAMDAIEHGEGLDDLD